MQSRTELERAEAIEKLKNNKEGCHQFYYFGDDNHTRIDIMISIIQNERNEAFVYENYHSVDKNNKEDTVAHGNWSTAMSAVQFLNGEYSITDLLYPEIK